MIVTAVIVTAVIVTAVIVTAVIVTGPGRLVAERCQGWACQGWAGNWRRARVCAFSSQWAFPGVNLSPRRETVAEEERKRDWNPLTHRERAVGACYPRVWAGLSGATAPTVPVLPRS